MLLSEILKNIRTEGSYSDLDISSISTDSRSTEKNCAFFCMKGRNHNSDYHAKEAFEKGASAIISEKMLYFPNSIKVDNIEEALAVCCDNFYGNPSERLKFIGITGTNGKTSVSYMISSILNYCEKKSGVIGTTGVFSDNKMLSESSLTTPEPFQLYSAFSELVNENAEYCVMEVSSQSLAQGRCENLNFETAVFTNLTPEHLDYHGNMENYLRAKLKLFSNSQKAVLNLDDEYFVPFSEKCKTYLTYSIRNKSADLYAKNIKQNENGVSYSLVSGSTEYDISLNCHGLFSVSNSLAAIGCCVFSGISIEKCAEALKNFNGVKGRAEILDTATPFKVMIDYAHTPDAVSNILSSVKTNTKGRVIALFGCGGDRDKEKRPLMLKAAAENSDYVIITSDNPRNENPYYIIKDILAGLDECNIPFAVIENREKAIEYALKIAKENDTVVLCGKGHETYQIIGNKKTEFDERIIVYKYINNE